MNAIETCISEVVKLSKDKSDVPDILDTLLKNLDPNGQMSPYCISLEDETLLELSKVFYPKERNSHPNYHEKEETSTPRIHKITVTSGDIFINNYVK